MLIEAVLDGAGVEPWRPHEISREQVQAVRDRGNLHQSPIIKVWHPRLLPHWAWVPPGHDPLGPLLNRCRHFGWGIEPRRSNLVHVNHRRASYSEPASRASASG